MIFVTVGTHEQAFNRLVQCVDELKANGVIEEEVVIQTGFSTYEPKHCTWSKLFAYDDMIKHVEEASIVITHGGPSSFIMPLQVGKIPIVVPRKKEYDEHVHDHQEDFAKEVEARQKNIIVVEDVNKLGETLQNYEKIVQSMSNGMTSNNENFNKEFSKIVDRLFAK